MGLTQPGSWVGIRQWWAFWLLGNGTDTSGLNLSLQRIEESGMMEKNLASPREQVGSTFIGERDTSDNGFPFGEGSTVMLSCGPVGWGVLASAVVGTGREGPKWGATSRLL